MAAKIVTGSSTTQASSATVVRLINSCSKAGGQFSAAPTIFYCKAIKRIQPSDRTAARSAGMEDISGRECLFRCAIGV